LEIVLGIVWLLLGTSSFVYWWTLKNDLTADLNIVVTALLAGLLGPLTYLVGLAVYAPATNRIIIKRRVRK
jgi:hypothetical protein